MRYNFIEVFGGSGGVTKCMDELGWIVGPVIDLDRSPHFNMADLRVLEWLMHLVEQGLLDSFMLSPPCTSFSAAAYPAVRSYAEPRGFDQTNPKTAIGNLLALRALSLLHLALVSGAVGLLEQPLLSKMAWLLEWRWFLRQPSTSETKVSSCRYGSPHKKEFRLLGANIDTTPASLRCQGGHKHIRIEGSYTKKSAVYVPALARAFAESFDISLRRKLRKNAEDHDTKAGLESVLVNDLLVSKRWEEVRAWRWKERPHINILETSAIYQLLKDQAISRPNTRFSIAVDSHVALAATAKGRSPSRALQPALRRIAAVSLAGGLYPALHYAPTRINPADHPTRLTSIPAPCDSCLHPGLSFAELLDFSGIASLRRPLSNWVRLVIFLRKGKVPWWNSAESWRFKHWGLKHFPYTWGQPKSHSSLSVCMDFDQTLGFPGEGPSAFSDRLCLFAVVFGFCLDVSLWTHALLEGQSLFGFLPSYPPGFSASFVSLWIFSVPHWPGPYPPNPQRVFWVIGGLSLGAEAMDHSNIAPRDRADLGRAATRRGVILAEGRPVLGKTQAHRDKLLQAFLDWVSSLGVDKDDLLTKQEVDIDMVNLMLEKYGRLLHAAGRPYNHYAETINALASKRPRLRRSLQGAWDLAFAWLREEPPVHHIAMPWQVLLAVISTACIWGWYDVAGILALTWGGICRIGEVLGARRCDLMLPCDFGQTFQYILLQIKEPKTRFRGARHQVSRVDQPQLVALIEVAFSHLHSEQKLWHMSGQAMRSRFKKLISAHKLDQQSIGTRRDLDLGSLRAGGATWLLEISEDSEMVRRRGRWLSPKIMEIYIQEVASVQFIHTLTAATRHIILQGVTIFPRILSLLKTWWLAGIPMISWKQLLDVQASTERVGTKELGKQGDLAKSHVQSTDSEVWKKELGRSWVVDV